MEVQWPWRSRSLCLIQAPLSVRASCRVSLGSSFFLFSCMGVVFGPVVVHTFYFHSSGSGAGQASQPARPRSERGAHSTRCRVSWLCWMRGVSRHVALDETLGKKMKRKKKKEQIIQKKWNKKITEERRRQEQIQTNLLSFNIYLRGEKEGRKGRE